MQDDKANIPLSREQQADLENQLRKAADENRVHCSRAFAIAKSLKVSPGEVGRTADKLNIRISKCQLGCF
ncbi:MAG: hypothetical protein R3297_00580 [Desulfobulbales bacterium]|nr:hypothetical protein [Desulfobulbales bacterium]